MIAAAESIWRFPGVWPWAVGASVLWWLTWRAFDRRDVRRLERLCGPRTLRVAEVSDSSRQLRRRIGLVGFVAAMVALLQPMWGVVARPVEQRGVDVVVCVDVSRSMLARDVVPNRLARAQQAIVGLLERVRGDRLALVAFAGEARLAVPLTHDMATFAELAALAAPRMIRRGGTDIGAAIGRAQRALKGADSDHRAIVLITDGEDHGEMGLRAAESCAAEGVVVHCVGYGSTRGSKIAVANESSQRESFMMDRQGAEVISAMDERGLRAIASAAGGAFVQGAESTQPLRTLYEARIVPVGRQLVAAAERRDRENRFQWPLLLACLCWLAELSMGKLREVR